MSTTEIKAAIDKMNREDRLFVAAYLRHLARAGDPAHRARLGAATRRMRAGKNVRLETVKRLHRNLESAGL